MRGDGDIKEIKKVISGVGIHYPRLAFLNFCPNVCNGASASSEQISLFCGWCVDNGRLAFLLRGHWDLDKCGTHSKSVKIPFKDLEIISGITNQDQTPCFEASESEIIYMALQLIRQGEANIEILNCYARTPREAMSDDF